MRNAGYKGFFGRESGFPETDGFAQSVRLQ